MWEPNKKQTSLPRLFLILVSGAVLFIALVLLLADLKCNYDIEDWWAVPYPGAETVNVEHKDWFRPRSIGETRWLLHSDDDEETVKQWYRDLTMQVLEEKRTRGIAHSDYRVTAAESGGSDILLLSTCAL